MKDNKICFNKSLIYLVFLIVLVVVSFYVMNYINSQKLTRNNEATTNFNKKWLKNRGANISITITSTTTSTITSTPYPTMSFGEKAKKYCQLQNDNYFKRTGIRYSVAKVASRYASGQTIQKCFKIKSKPVYITGCRTEQCIRCVNEEVEAQYCNNPSEAYLPKTTCPSVDDKAKIKSIVEAINESNMVRFKLSPNYYGWENTTGACVLKKGMLDKQQSILDITPGNTNNLIKYGGQCLNKKVADDYCVCATWRNEYPRAECENVKNWISQEIYDYNFD